MLVKLGTVQFPSRRFVDSVSEVTDICLNRMDEPGLLEEVISSFILFIYLFVCLFQDLNERRIRFFLQFYEWDLNNWRLHGQIEDMDEEDQVCYLFVC